MIKALTRAEVIEKWPKGSDFALTDLRTGVRFTGRGSPPINYDHSDWQYKTKGDYDTVRAFAGRSWNGRPALLETPSGLITCVSYHTYNHSIPVASGAYDIVSPVLKRTKTGDKSTYGPGYEKDANGNWNVGSHHCMHYIDSINARAKTSYTLNMNAAVQEAVMLSNNMTQDPTMPLLYSGSSGSYVKEAQGLINDKGYTPALGVDGSYGAKTKAAVEWVQKKYGLEQSGMVTADTWKVLRAEEGQPTVDEQQVSGTGDNPSPWAMESTRWAIAEGLFKGDGLGNYDWQGAMTREMMAVLLRSFRDMYGGAI